MPLTENHYQAGGGGNFLNNILLFSMSTDTDNASSLTFSQLKYTLNYVVGI